MSLQDDAQAAVTAAQTVLDDVNNKMETPADKLLDAVMAAVETEGLANLFGADKLVSELESLNYTITAPASTDTPELPA